MHRIFNISSPGTCRDSCNTVHVRWSFSPERDSVFVDDMGSRFSNPKEFGDLIPFGFEFQPTFYHILSPGEP